MPTGSRGTNTMSEGLAKMLSDISQMKLTPDADLEFLIGLETMILQKAKNDVQGALNPGAGAMPGMPPMPGGMAGPPPGAISPDAAGLRGVASSPSLPNPDELRRMVNT